MCESKSDLVLEPPPVQAALLFQEEVPLCPISIVAGASLGDSSFFCGTLGGKTLLFCRHALPDGLPRSRKLFLRHLLFDPLNLTELEAVADAKAQALEVAAPHPPPDALDVAAPALGKLAYT